MNRKTLPAIVWLVLGAAQALPAFAAPPRVIAGRELARWAADLNDSNETIRLRAAKTIGLFGESAVPELTKMLAHRDASVRYYAAESLGDLGAAGASREALAACFQDDTSPSVRMAAAYALATVDADPAMLKALLDFASGEERGAAVAAADLLGRIGASAESTLTSLEALRQRHAQGPGSDYHVRGAVQNAIRKIREDRTLPNHVRPVSGGQLRGWGGRKSAPRKTVEPDRKRPNILWISCEDISPNLGCYGDTFASTPNLDQLAKEGCRYQAAFTPAGVCAVVRSGLITGMYPISIGSQHMRARIVPPPAVRCFPEYLRQAGYFCTNKSKTDYQFDPPVTAWDRQGNGHDDWRDRAPGQPFFSVINLTISHESQIRHSDAVHAELLARLQPGQRHDSKAAAETVPPIYAPTPETLKDWARYHDNISEMDRQVGEILARLKEDGLVDSTVVVFWSDHGRGLPRGKRWIYDAGVHIPMIVRWPGVVEAESASDELVSTQDLAPTTLVMAGLDPPAYMHGRVFVGPRKEPPPPLLFFHRDRMDEAVDLMRGARDQRFKYIRNYEPDRPYAQHIDYMDHMPTLVDLRRLHAEGKLTGPQLAFMRETKPLEELYDILADPHETVNLADAPEHAETLARMRLAVEQWQVKMGDQGLVPEPIMMERMRPGNRTEKTAPVVVSFHVRDDAQLAALACETQGASIAYALQNEQHWRLYHQPIKVAPGTVLRAKAVRLGFAPSETTRATAP